MSILLLFASAIHMGKAQGLQMPVMIAILRLRLCHNTDMFRQSIFYKCKHLYIYCNYKSPKRDYVCERQQI